MPTRLRAAHRPANRIISPPTHVTIDLGCQTSLQNAGSWIEASRSGP